VAASSPSLVTKRQARESSGEDAAAFFAQVGVGAQTSAEAAALALRAAGDSTPRAIAFHGDHLELSEQFDDATGFEKSVRDLTWSYAAFLSALRAR